MAKGIGGKTYEALLHVCLQRLLEDHVLAGILMWNTKPEAISVVPDFLVGESIEKPSFVFAVSHGDSPKESNRKCWRNISELCEMKTRLATTPVVINVVFDSHIKEDIKQLQAEAFDGQLIIGDASYGSSVIDWVNTNMSSLPVDQEEKASAISIRSSSDKRLSELISFIVRDLKRVIETSTANRLGSLWEMERARPIKNIPPMKTTFYKRGFAKRLLVGDSIKNKEIDEREGLWLSELKLAKKTIGGFRIIDEELRWFINSRFNTTYKSVAEKCSTEGFTLQMKKIRNLALVEIYCQFVFDRYDVLTTPDGMYSCLCKQFVDPTTDIEIPSSFDKPQNVWMYDIVTALTKAATQKSQGFGYSFFATHSAADHSQIGGMTVGEWCSCFMNQFFSRKESFRAPDVAVRHVALVLAEQLSTIDKNSILKTQKDISEKYITKEYEDTYLSHRGFSPLQQLLIEEGITADNSVRIRTCFGEKAGLTGQSGTCSVSRSKKTIIKCISAFANPMDKRKELCAQAVGLRYSWNNERRVFEKRPDVDKLILLLDGTWSQKDLSLLISAGWDEIYYPDEIDKLKAAIV